MADPRYRFDPVLYQAVTPVHVGAGQDVGLVDLPVVRERTTDHPYLPGSGIRGALRDRCQSADGADGLVPRLFGSDEGEEIRSGCLSILDAHLLLFPVRSHPGLFHWITCGYAIRRFRRLHADLTGAPPELAAPPEGPEEGTFLGGGAAASLYLEEYEFSRGAGTWSWGLGLDGVAPDRVVLLSEADFLHFVRYATVVRQRNRLSTAKTVLHGQLFSVEMVPAESWFAGFLGATAERVPPVDEGEEEALERGDGAAPGEGSRSGAETPEAGGEEASGKSPGGGSTPLDKDQAANELRRLLAGRKDGPETFLTLGGDESVGLGVTRMRWLAASPADTTEGQGDAPA